MCVLMFSLVGKSCSRTAREPLGGGGGLATTVFMDLEHASGSNSAGSVEFHLWGPPVVPAEEDTRAQ